MINLLAVLLVLSATSVFGFDIRVSFYSQGNAQHRDEVVASCWSEFSALRGVKVLEAPASVDYMILLAVRDTPSAVAISAHVQEQMDPKLSERFYIKSDYKDQMEPAGAVVNLLAPLGQEEMEIGPSESIKGMCHTLAELIDRFTFGKERANPRGGSFDDAYQNFLLRSGSRRVAK